MTYRSDEMGRVEREHAIVSARNRGRQRWRRRNCERGGVRCGPERVERRDFDPGHALDVLHTTLDAGCIFRLTEIALSNAEQAFRGCAAAGGNDSKGARDGYEDGFALVAGKQAEGQRE